MTREMTPVNALILEDNPADAELMVEELRRHGFAPRWERVDTEEDYAARLGAGWDVILADYRLPTFDPVQALVLRRDSGLDIPFIIVSGSIGEEAAVRCLQYGADDYLSKDRLRRLGAAVECALEGRRLREEKQGAEAEVRRTASMLRAVLDALPVGVWLADAEGKITEANPAGRRIWAGERYVGIDGYGEYKGWWAETGEPIAPEEWALARAITRGETSIGEVVDIECFDGSRKTILNSALPLRDGEGRITGAIVVNEDITERRRIEADLRQAQKMEGVGQLAGGIAHDFNNLLTVILGRVDLLLMRPALEATVLRDLTLVHKTAGRAAALTRQLLAFSRKQPLRPVVLEVNTVVEGLVPMLERLIGEHIHLQTALAPGAGRIRADASQIEQVIVNLAVNARDAMPDGGRLAVATAAVEVDLALAERNPGLRPGPHVMLTVSDSGVGMDAGTRQRIFEPFFTTKEVGKGTGLGLASVYGIVKQHGGHIEVQSAPGLGTAFRIYLPAVEEAGEAAPGPAGTPAPAQRATGTILLAEDEEALRSLAVEILDTAGYTVLEAPDAAEALAMAERHTGPIHLLLTDVKMPVMTGPALARMVAALHPETRVLYMSGYTGDVPGSRDRLGPGARLLPKPFTPEVLARAVREALNGKA